MSSVRPSPGSSRRGGPATGPRLTRLDGREPGPDHQVGRRPSRNLTATDIMTAADVADLLTVAPTTVYEWARTGVLPAMRRGRVIRFRRWQVEAWIADDQG